MYPIPGRPGIFLSSGNSRHGVNQSESRQQDIPCGNCSAMSAYFSRFNNHHINKYAIRQQRHPTRRGCLIARRQSNVLPLCLHAKNSKSALRMKKAFPQSSDAGRLNSSAQGLECVSAIPVRRFDLSGTRAATRANQAQQRIWLSCVVLIHTVPCSAGALAMPLAVMLSLQNR